PLIKIAFNDYISELMSEKITTALKNNTKVELSPEEKIEEIEEADTDDGICTTEQEREAFYSVRTILNEVMPREDVTYKDTKAYFGILYKDNTWKWICRFKFKKNGLVFTLPDDNKKEIRHDLKNLDEINNFKNEIRAVGKRYVGE
ncbi:MAG: hypothetical protein RR233_08600, partial [Clostridiales bacterium]